MRGKVWTEEQDAVLREMYAEHFAGEIAAIVGKSKSAVYGRAQKLALKSSEEKIRRSGQINVDHPNKVAHQFRKGNIPPNKGKKVSPELYAKMQPTMFKKGRPSLNHREVGSERVNVDGYIEVKVAEPNKWRLKNRVVWEQANGPIPPGHNVQFRNGNKLDCRLENLYLIDRRVQFMTHNSIYARYPKELQYVMKLKGALVRQIHRREKDAEQ